MEVVNDDPVGMQLPLFGIVRATPRQVRAIVRQHVLIVRWRHSQHRSEARRARRSPHPQPSSRSAYRGAGP
jgi:hypothetical protein